MTIYDILVERRTSVRGWSKPVITYNGDEGDNTLVYVIDSGGYIIIRHWYDRVSSLSYWYACGRK